MCSKRRVVTSFSLCPQMMRALERRARREGISKGELIRRAIESYLRSPLLGDLLVERGVITEEELEELLREQRKRRGLS